MFYSSKIMADVGSANIVTALVGLVNCVSVIPTLYLFSKFGRKSLLWTLSFAISAMLFGLGVSLILSGDGAVKNATAQGLSVVFLMFFIIFFEFSLGPLLWIYMSEIMTEKGLSLGAGVFWFVTVIIAQFSQSLITSLGGGQDNLGSGRLFLICGGFTAVSGLFCLLFIKETKGLTEKEVFALYSSHSNHVKIDTEASSLQLDNGNT